jgi:type III secretion protein W
MTQSIERAGAAPFSAPASEPQGGIPEGSFRGEAVRVEQNAASLMADAAEELSFSASETVEKKLSERKEGKERPKGLDKILLYVDQAGDMNRSDLEELLKRLAAVKNAGAGEILELTRQMFKDPTNRHAALAYARNNLDKAGISGEQAAALGKELDATLSELERTEGRAINAGYNTAGLDAPGLNLAPVSLRVLYRDTVVDFENYEKTFSSLMQKFGPEEFPKAVTWLIRALGGDMAALKPSGEPAALKEIMDGLYMVESLSTLYRDASGLLKGAAERHGPHDIREKDMLEPLLRYKDAPAPSARQIGADMRFLVSDNAVRDAELTQGVRELARTMPHKLYVSAEARFAVLTSFQELLDKAVDREEEARAM